ncbi:hypothetical protein IWW55_002881 [Coemansia sp. RSA 2706]|nr:hypothetical protein IWW55_002881 [Coemansia sp. RSA 2706]KAJ2385499.1 hypothetical protein H4S02_004300 [Coemansia sp. RSA 2611]
MLVISTALGINDWLAYLLRTRSTCQPSTVSWVVYSRSLPLECVLQSQVVFVCVADADHLLTQLGIGYWAHVALDKTATGEQLLATVPGLEAALNTKTTLLV